MNEFIRKIFTRVFFKEDKALCISDNKDQEGNFASKKAHTLSRNTVQSGTEMWTELNTVFLFFQYSNSERVSINFLRGYEQNAH